MRSKSVGILAVGVAAVLAASPAWGTVTLSTVPVGHPGNTADSATGKGSVSYTYEICKYEVTLTQYCEFLNAIAKTDTYGVYNSNMKISRTGSPGSYTYAPSVDGNRPANGMSWGNAARFANWMHNGQPTGAQNASTTEDGSYYVNGKTSQADLFTVTRKAGATWVIPSVDEWYKAAYYKASTGYYYLYPTSTDTMEWNFANYQWGTETTVVGYYSAYPSPYGTYDQGGNASEWTEATEGTSNGILRGGQYNFGEELLQSTSSGLTAGRDAIYVPYGFRLVNLVTDPNRINPNDDCTIINGVNYNNYNPEHAPGSDTFGLFAKSGTQVSYLEFTLGTTHVTEAKLTLWQDDAGVKPEVTWNINVRGAEYSFDEVTFNITGAGNTWPLIANFDMTGTPVTRYYNIDITDWYNANLGRTMSLFLQATAIADPDTGPIFEDREGSRTGNPVNYGPRIEITPSNTPCHSTVTPGETQTSAGTVGRATWPRTLYYSYINSGTSTNGYNVALTDDSGSPQSYAWLSLSKSGNSSVPAGGTDSVAVDVTTAGLTEGTHTGYITFTDNCSPATQHIRQIDLVLNPVSKVLIDTTPILNTDNAADTRYEPSGIGAVAYEFRMGKYEVTAAQYCEFLNAVAKTDTNNLYNTQMWTEVDAPCKIERLGTSGNYSYRVAEGYEKRPVNFVSFSDAIRFANWLHNGQPTGAQGATTTEDGAYTIGSIGTVTRNAGATWVIPSEDEWYKVAYYDPTLGSGGYWDYPTRSNTINTTMANYDNAVGRPSDVGSYGYPSFYGSLDQGGNIREWTELIPTAGSRNTRGGAYNFGGTTLASNFSVSESFGDEYRNLGFRVATLDLGDPNRINPNDDTTVRGTTNYNNTGNFGLFVKRNGDVSYLEFWLGNTPTVSAKLVLWQDNAELNVGYNVVVRGDEFDFNESTFNNSSLGDTWPQLGTLAVSGVEPVQAFYELDITDWYNDNLGKRMSIFLRNDGTWNEYQSPMFEDREGTRTGDPETYGPRIVIDILQCNTPWADADGDGDVDMDDFAMFQRCFSGSEMLSVDADEYCRCFDRNSDGKVNNTDLAAFEACSTGPGVIWVSSPECP